MSREIKFRAWIEAVLSEETGLYYPTVMQLMADGSVDKLWTNDYKFTADTSKFTLMQYTGLKDKNGTEIYENDIVSDGSRSFSVVWSDNMCWMYLQSTNSQQTASLSIKTAPSLEVIGNKYENPELLTA